MDYAKLEAQLRVDEAVRRRRYLDNAKPPRWTIGVGHNIDADPHYPYQLTDEPLTDAQIDTLLGRDIAAAVSALDQYANWWRAMEEPRQRVLANMCFNMGWSRLAGFVNTLDAMHKSQYAAAAAGMRASLWASQVGDRAERLAKIMETGEG